MGDPELDYLGHWNSVAGVLPFSSHVAAISEVSPPVHGQKAPVLSRNGELLQKVPPRSRMHPPTPDGQAKWQQEGVGAKRTNNCYFLQISFILEYTVKIAKRSFHDQSKMNVYCKHDKQNLAGWELQRKGMQLRNFITELDRLTNAVY